MDVLFSGTPCQVAAVKRYFASADTEKLLLCDMVCMGVPSPLMLQEYFSYVEKKTGRKVVGHACRSKAEGWGTHLESLRFQDGREDHTSFLSQIYGRMFGSKLILRPACANCKYANLHRPGDITMGDFWGIETRHPEFHDKRGVSLVLVNTPTGEAAFEAIRGEVERVQATVQDAASERQVHLQRPVVPSPDRALFWQEYHKNGFESAIKKYAICSAKDRLRYDLKRVTQRMGVYPVLKRVKDAIMNLITHDEAI